MPDETTSPPPVLVVMGVSGTGKSTVAGLLAGHLGWPMEEGDDLHPEANVDKMEQGVPLTDDDRWPWLDRIGEWIDEQGRRGEPGIITCSALKRSYRDRLRRPNVVFVHLAGTRDTISAPDGRPLGPLHAAQPARLPARDPRAARAPTSR